MVRSLALLLLIAVPAVASAADYAVREPTFVEGSVVAPGLWRGHFSGGVNTNPYADDIALAWSDQVAFFPDDRGCRRWIRSLRAQIKPYEGWSGCLRIR